MRVNLKDNAGRMPLTLNPKPITLNPEPSTLTLTPHCTFLSRGSG